MTSSATIPSVRSAGTPGRKAACRSCAAVDLVTFHRVAAVPVQCSSLLSSADAAAAVATGELEMVVCSACGFVQNQAFDPDLAVYDDDYEDSQLHSALFRTYLETLVDDLVVRHHLTGRHAIEIGCGRGEFLELLAARAGMSGLGLDPTYRGPVETADGRVRFERRPYRADDPAGVAALVACRHTLEHISDVAEFVGLLSRNLVLADDTIVFFEVPDSERILDETAFWDVYYEHCSYFTRGTLTDLFARSGFDVTSTRLAYGDQYILLDARPGGSRPPVDVDSERMVERAVAFGDRVAREAAHWVELIDRATGPVVLWGATSKTVGFLAVTGLADRIAVVTDVNPQKWGRHLPGTGLPVVPPADLAIIEPEVVIAMNPLYRAEIAADLASFAVDPKLLAL